MTFVCEFPGSVQLCLLVLGYDGIHPINQLQGASRRRSVTHLALVLIHV